MRITFEGRWFHFDLEIGSAKWRPKKYEVLPKKSCSRVRDHLWRSVAKKLRQRTDTTWTN
jgi:hypothetical protein